MMEESVTNTGLVDVSRFRVIYFESLIWAVSIGFISEFIVKSEDIVD